MTEQEILDTLNECESGTKVPMELVARVIFNLERIATAQEILAGIKKPRLAPE